MRHRDEGVGYRRARLAVSLLALCRSVSFASKRRQAAALQSPEDFRGEKDSYQFAPIRGSHYSRPIFFSTAMKRGCDRSASHAGSFSTGLIERASLFLFFFSTASKLLSHSAAIPFRLHKIAQGFFAEKIYPA